MSKEENQEQDKIILELCYFKVPFKIQPKKVELEEGQEPDTSGEPEMEAVFEEVDLTDRCFKIEPIETTSGDDAIKKSQELSQANYMALRIAHKVSKPGDLIVKQVLCKKGSVTINTELQ